MRVRRIAVGAVAAGAMAAAPLPAAAQSGPLAPPPGARPQLDVRSGERAAVPPHVRAARSALAERLGIEGRVAADPVGGGLRVLSRTDGFLSGPRAGDAADVALAYVRAHADVFGLDAQKLAALQLTERTTSNDDVTHLTWTPFRQGVPAYDAALRVHVARDGRVVAASGPPLGGGPPASTAPRLTASEALAIAQADVDAPPALPRANTHTGPQRLTTFSNGDRARLVVFDAPDGDRLAWRLTVAGRTPYLYDELIDALSGEILARHSLTDFAVAHADVFPYHPDAAAGGSEVQVDIGPWLNPLATTLVGPNAHAWADIDDDNDFADAGEEIGPSSGNDWLYPLQSVAPGSGAHCTPWSFCTWGGTSGTLASEATNRSHATTQLFYLVNTFHDWLAGAPFGFTSASGSFDGADPLDAQADDSIPNGTTHFVNNANMSTPPDGFSPRMQMYLWTSPFPAVNGSDDASVVFHEYTHGLSNRLIGNGDGLNAKQSGAMGEGWSDWYAMDYLADPAHPGVTDTAADGEVRVGEYATGDTTGGIRHQPLDCPVGSSAPACGGSFFAGHAGGFTYADLGRVGGDAIDTPSFEVHDDGEIWAETLWDLRTALGAPTARRLVTNGMRLSPVNPSFLDERDAILLADQTRFAGVHHDQLWTLFATRGMGWGAHTASANSTSATASFSATPLLATATAADDAAPLGDGDGVAEPGEALRLRVALEDPSPTALTNVAATLTTSAPGVSVGAASASWGTIAGGGSAQNATPFELSVSGLVPCGTQAPLTLHVTSDQGGVDLPLALALGSDGADESFATASNLELAIPENPATHVSSTLTVPSDGRVRHLRVTLSVTHAWVGDLRARLTSPSGTTIDLFQRPGNGDFGSGFQWSGAPVTFDDAAASSIQDLGDGPGTLTGTWAPDEPLARFAGEQRAGTWTLRMSDGFDDSAPASERTLHGWSIATGVPACSAPPASPGPAPARPVSGGTGTVGGSGAGSSSGTRTIAPPTHVTRRARLDRRGRFVYAFHATSGLHGSVRFTLPKRGRIKAIVFGRRSFTVPPSGRVRLTIRVRGKALTQLRKRHRATVRVTIKLGGVSFVRALRLVAPRPRR
jgi:subtilisin-like proprotein convertase family protein